MNEDNSYYSYLGTDYDNNSTVDPHSIFNWYELAPTLIIYGITFVLGLTGNSLIIIATFRYRRMKNVTNVLLSSLAMSDLLLIVFCIPVKVAKLFSYTWRMGVFICKGVHYMQNLSAICSVLTLTAISLERYYAIVYPMKAKYTCTLSQAKKIVIVIWILSVVLSIPTLEGQIHLPVGPTKEYRYCVRNWDNGRVWKFHELYLLFVVLVGPFSIITFSYVTICRKIWKVMGKTLTTNEQPLSRNYRSLPTDEKQSTVTSACGEWGSTRKSTNQHHDTHVVQQVIFMLVVVVALFAICWAPLLVDNVLTAFAVLPHMRFGGLKYMSSAFHLLAYFNSCVNPVVYGFMSKNFRDNFLLQICFKPHPRERESVFEKTLSLKRLSRMESQTKSTTIRS
ncbi:unnamed protein product [Acanthoscelides obtectus]|uniref:G-protein coupled receptors family 1 profile domain-containing protein n=1 Tax=Acanthoscelides obtectus TaxID=200917 RepID=A0A9P0L9C9_ACAOB|nr:unnamed protein product [Acanthoscelides obtectus]CAH1990366.1 unnamed protein product [Acanthoscelides obtectus]CAK1648829.1 Cholecystokinin receptor [Acanthoscelides obtectus]CAK1648830.1 Cholecystokinin receptor [Acanthoscelides obtectus]